MLLTITACGGDEDTDNVIKQVQLEKTGVNTLNHPLIKTQSTK